jgi:hypothetical protein
VDQPTLINIGLLFHINAEYYRVSGIILSPLAPSSLRFENALHIACLQVGWSYTVSKVGAEECRDENTMTWRGDAATRLSSGSPCVFRAAEALARLLPRHPGLLPELPHMTANTKITISKQNTRTCRWQYYSTERQLASFEKYEGFFLAPDTLSQQFPLHYGFHRGHSLNLILHYLWSSNC